MRVGDQVPDFSLVASDGATFRLSSALGQGPVVLFFYPKAFSAGCTIEVRHFQSRLGEFHSLGAQPVGISRDPPDTQARFASGCLAQFPLLSDPGGEVSRLFGVKGWAGLPGARATFVITPGGRALAVISNPLNMKAHADGALRALAGAQGAKNSLSGAQ